MMVVGLCVCVCVGRGGGGVHMLRTFGDLLGRDRGDPRCLSSPAHKEARSKLTAALFFLRPLPLFPPPPFFLLLCAGAECQQPRRLISIC